MDALTRTMLWISLWVPLAVACGDGDPRSGALGTLSREELMNPETCEQCHADAFREWSSSMHAYATLDPVFRAMNQRGQDETGGALGDFCVRCHAPMAVRDGVTDDGTNLDELGPEYRGITCYFCHNVDGLEAEHDSANNPLTVANDTTMRGGLREPEAMRPSAHGVAYSELHDSKGHPIKSSELCGTCHDIVTPSGVHLERTYAEWQQSIFANDAPKGCGGCHMPGLDAPAAVTDELQVPLRRRHSHLFAGVDTALTNFPDIELQKAAIACELSPAVRAELVPSPTGEFKVVLEANVAHAWPSGAAQDRRAWVQFTAFDANDEVIFESGNVGPEEYVLKPADDPDYDRNLFAMNEFLFDADGNPTHMFWEVDKSEQHPEGLESFTLPPATDLLKPHTRERSYQVIPAPARVRVSVHIRPMGLDVIDDLIGSGHLAAEIRDRFTDVELTGTILEWTSAQGKEDGYRPVTAPEGNPLDCPNEWRCLLYPDYVGCGS